MTGGSDWLPPGKVAAVCLSVDDVHPGRSTDDYEAGGDLDSGVLGRLRELFDAHPRLRATLFVTPDWRERSPSPTRRRLARVPVVREHVHLTRPRRRGTMRLDRHPTVADYLRSEPRFELAVHGLTHLARGSRPPAEFERLGVRAARRRLERARAIFAAARLPVEPGFCAPAWAFGPALARALPAAGFQWVSAARDIETPVAPGARTAGSGLHGLPLAAPSVLPGSLVHLPVNFQATSGQARADAVVAAGGLLSIKAHAIKDALGHIALDGLDGAYAEKLHELFTELEARYGDALWWTTLGETAARVAA